MKKMTMITILMAALLALLGTAIHTSAGPARDPVQGEGQAVYNGDLSAATGSTTLYIRGQQYDLVHMAMPISPPKFTDDGIHVTTTHIFRFDTDSDGYDSDDEFFFSTTDKCVLEYTDQPWVFVMNSNMEITTEGFSGRTHAHGTAQFWPGGTVSYVINGVIGLPAAD